MGPFYCRNLLLGFGSSFLRLTWTRLQSLLAASDACSKPIELFLDLYVPEQQPSVIYRTSTALIVSTIFGLLYEGLGARFLNRDLHPDYTVFHYATHLTLTLLYLFAGWTGLLEYYKYLPKDSLRASIVLAL